MSRFGLVEYVKRKAEEFDKVLENAEKRVRSWEKDYQSKVEHRSPCIHCGEIVLGSRASGFRHSNGAVRCDLPDFPEDHTVKATPKSLFPPKKGNK